MFPGHIIQIRREASTLNQLVGYMFRDCVYRFAEAKAIMRDWKGRGAITVTAEDIEAGFYESIRRLYDNMPEKEQKYKS